MTGKTNGLQLNCSSLLNDSFNFKCGLINLYRVFSLSFWMGFETLADVYSSADYSVLSHWDVCTSLHKHPILYTAHCTSCFLVCLLNFLLVGTLKKEELAEPQE